MHTGRRGAATHLQWDCAEVETGYPQGRNRIGSTQKPRQSRTKISIGSPCARNKPRTKLPSDGRANVDAQLQQGRRAVTTGSQQIRHKSQQRRLGVAARGRARRTLVATRARQGRDEVAPTGCKNATNRWRRGRNKKGLTRFTKRAQVDHTRCRDGVATRAPKRRQWAVLKVATRSQRGRTGVTTRSQQGRALRGSPLLDRRGVCHKATTGLPSGMGTKCCPRQGRAKVKTRSEADRNEVAAGSRLGSNGANYLATKAVQGRATVKHGIVARSPRGRNGVSTKSHCNRKRGGNQVATGGDQVATRTQQGPATRSLPGRNQSRHKVTRVWQLGCGKLAPRSRRGFNKVATRSWRGFAKGRNQIAVKSHRGRNRVATTSVTRRRWVATGSRPCAQIDRKVAVTQRHGDHGAASGCDEVVVGLRRGRNKVRGASQAGRNWVTTWSRHDRTRVANGIATTPQHMGAVAIMDA